MAYDDLMGLDMYGLDGFMSMDMLKDSVMAGAAGAGAILLATWGTPKLPAPASWSAANQHRMRAGVATALGILAGRGLWNYNRDAAMAVIGGVAGLGLAQLIDSFFDNKLLSGTPLGALSDGDEALLSAYDNGNMSALASLEATGVAANAPAFSGMGDPTVTREALMGTVSQMETLGGLADSYQPYLS